MKVLLVDDDMFLCDMYATKFSEMGYTVEVSMKPREVLTMLQEKTFDVLLTDVIMPGMTGIELIQEIREKFPDAIKKFIVLSNQSDPNDIANAKHAKVDGYIIKAESLPSEVVEQVQKIVNEK